MKDGGKIGFITSLAALGAGLLLAFRFNTQETNEPTSKKEKIQKKQEKEDSFLTQSNKSIKGRFTSSHLFKQASYKKDLKKWGTTQNLMDVSNDQLVGKKRSNTIKNMAEVGTTMFKTSMPKIVKTKHKKQPQEYDKFYGWLIKEFHKLQVTITNSSTQEKTIRLWGNNSNTISPPLPTDVEDHEVIQQIDTNATAGSANHPQGVAVNPANELTYVANQLSNNVTVADKTGEVVTIIQLQPSLLPGFNSPVAITINTNAVSSNYGKIYVAGSVSNTISVIDLAHQVTNEISVGVRPLDLAFNPINNQIYVANLFSDTVSVIDTITETMVTTLNVGTDPLGVGINTKNGDIYVTNSGSHSVSVFNSSNTLVTTITGVGTNPVSATYHPINDEMYVVATDSNTIHPIAASTHTILTPIPTGNSPYTSIFNTNNNFLYVGNRADNTFTVIALDKTIQATITNGNVNIGFAINQAENQLWVTDTAANLINIIGYADQSNGISISDNYKRNANDFTYNPAIIKHTKWVLSGQERFKLLHFIEENSTGTKKSYPISHESYRSPQNFLNVSEIHDLEGTVIDYDTTWKFKIAAKQTITIMVYFRQFKMNKHIP